MQAELIVRLAKAFNKLDIPYMIIGGQAALIYREPRFTNDIDIVLGLDADGYDEVIKLCRENNFQILVENPFEFINQTYVLPVVDKTSNFRIDIIFSESDFERDALKRTNKIEIDGNEIDFCSIEDFIILKIFSGRPRDIEDVKAVIIKNPNINNDMIKDNLDKLGKTLDIDFLEKFSDIMNSFKKK